jgi:hypothetical protein
MYSEPGGAGGDSDGSGGNFNITQRSSGPDSSDDEDHPRRSSKQRGGRGSGGKSRGARHGSGSAGQARASTYVQDVTVDDVDGSPMSEHSV